MEQRPKKTAEQKRLEASDGIAAYRAREDAAYRNMLRLREERLAREAAQPPTPEKGKRAAKKAAIAK